MTSPYPLPDVVGIDVYRDDVVVRRRGYRRHSVDWTRSDITEFTKASRQRLAFIASNTDVIFTAMLTLTYPRRFPTDGAIVKRHFKAFREALRRKWPGASYLWFLEFQKRGAPHIHVLVRGIRVSRTSIQWLSQTWYRICNTGDPRHLRAGTRIERIRKRDGAKRYATKYAFKMRQKKVPAHYVNVGRFWGYTRDVAPKVMSSHACTNDDLVGALDITGWRWQHGDTIRWRTLHGASKHLRLWLSGSILELNSSLRKAQYSQQTERGTNDDG